MVDLADRAAAKAITVVYNTTDVVLDALVDLHRDSYSSLAYELLQIVSSHMIVGLETVYFENWIYISLIIAITRHKLMLRSLLHFAVANLVLVRVLVGCG